MRNKTLCSFNTRRGAPCRNPARPGSDPPACRRHADRPRSDDAPTTAAPPTPPRHSPQLMAEELAALEGGGATDDLRAELALVRFVLRQLLNALTATDDLSPEDLRRLSALTFTGARTVAHLLAQQAGRAGEAQAWLAGALEELGEKHGVSL